MAGVAQRRRELQGSLKKIKLVPGSLHSAEARGRVHTRARSVINTRGQCQGTEGSSRDQSRQRDRPEVEVKARFRARALKAVHSWVRPKAKEASGTKEGITDNPGLGGLRRRARLAFFGRLHPPLTGWCSSYLGLQSSGRLGGLAVGRGRTETHGPATQRLRSGVPCAWSPRPKRRERRGLEATPPPALALGPWGCSAPRRVPPPRRKYSLLKL